MAEINWNMAQVPDAGATFLQAFKQGREDKRNELGRNALSAYAVNPGEKTLNDLAKYAPELAIQQKQQMQQTQLAHAKQRVEMIGQAAMWADTPEKWDAAVSYLEQQGMPEVAQYRGKFTPELRMSAISSAGQLKAQLEAEKPLVGRPGDWVMDPRDPSKVLQKVPFAPHYGVVGEGQTAFVDNPGQPAVGGVAGALTTNPGAIKDGGFARSMPGYTGNSGGFATFATPEQGIAAQETLLAKAYVGKGFNTISKIVDRYAPPGPENSPASVANYKAYIAQRTGLDINQPLTAADVPAIAAAQREFETGQRPGGTRVIAQGAKKAGDGTPTGLLERGYRLKPDGTMEPIPGGPADPGSIDMPAPKEMAKRNAAYPKVAGAWRTASSKIDQQITDVKKLLAMPGLASIVGPVDGRTPTFLPEASAAKALYDQVMARAQFNELQEMRNSSPTGGALGAVSDSENKTLRDAAAALDRKQAETDFEARAKDYLFTLERAKGNLQQTFEETYSYRKAQQGGNQPAGDVDAILRKYGVR